MAVLSTLVVAPISQRTPTVLQIGGCTRRRDTSLPGAINWLFEQDTPVSVAGTIAMVAKNVPAAIWPGGSATLDVTHHAYVIFVVQGSATLWAAKQQDFAAIAGGNAVGKIAWVDGQHDLLPRGTFGPSALTLALLSGNSNLSSPTDAPHDLYFHQYGTDSTPHLTYPEPDGSNTAKTITSGTDTYVINRAYSRVINSVTNKELLYGLNRNRLAANGSGTTLLISDDGTLWTDGGTQVTIAEPSGISGINGHHCMAITYNRSTRRWWLLYESVKYAAGPDYTSVLDRAVFTLYYDEAAHGAINPASGANWVIGRTLQTQMVQQPGIDPATPASWFFYENYGGTTADGVINAVRNLASFTVWTGTANVTAAATQFLDFTSLMDGTPNQVIAFDITSDNAGTLSINGGGTVVAHIKLFANNGRIAGEESDTLTYSNQYPIVDNDPSIGTSGGLYWINNNPPAPPVFNPVPWYRLESGGTALSLHHSTCDLSTCGNNWIANPGGFSDGFPSSIYTGFIRVVYISGQPTSFPFVTYDIDNVGTGATYPMPTGMQNTTWKYWTNFDVVLEQADGLGSGGAPYRRLRYHYGSGTDVIAGLWTGNYPLVITTGSTTFPMRVGMTQDIVYKMFSNGIYYGIGENGETVGYSQIAGTAKYYGPSGDHAVSPVAPFIVDAATSPTVNPTIYKMVGMGAGHDHAPFLDAGGHIVDSAGALDASLVFRAVCSDNAGGIYAIAGVDLVRRAGAFGTAWTTIEAGVSTESTILLLRLMEDTTILLVEGTNGSVRTAIWDGASVTRGAYFAFDTDDSYLAQAFPPANEFSAFSVAAVTS